MRASPCQERAPACCCSDAAPHRTRTADRLRAEEERQAAAEKEERDPRAAAREVVCGGNARERGAGCADVPEHHSAEDQHQHELDSGGDEEHAEDGQRPEQHEADDRHRHGHLDQPAPRLDAGEDVRQHLVDDVGDRVRQIEERADRPDPRLNEGGATADGSLDECGEAACRDDLLAVAEPDEEREGVQHGADEREQPGRAQVARAGKVDRRERERAADRRDGEADIQRRGDR